MTKHKPITDVFITRLLYSQDYCTVTFFRGKKMTETEIRKFYRIRRLANMLKGYPQKVHYTDNSVMVEYKIK